MGPLNMVGRFLRDITENLIRCDSFTSVPELELALDVYVAQHNIEPKPFIWTVGASDILAKVTRAKAALARLQDKYRTAPRSTLEYGDVWWEGTSLQERDPCFVPQGAVLLLVLTDQMEFTDCISVLLHADANLSDCARCCNLDV